MEVEVLAEEEEEEIELSLGLSIGGGRKFEKKSNVHDQKSMIKIFDFQFCENDRRRMMRREIHKMRRQEARKKQIHQKKKNVVVRKYFEEDGSEQQQICKKKLRSEKEEVVGFPSIHEYDVPSHHMMPSWIPGPNGELPSFDFQQNVTSRCDDKTTAAGNSSSSSSSSAAGSHGSHHGGSSCETRSHSFQSSPAALEQTQLNVPVMSSNIEVQNTSIFNPTESSNIVYSNDAQSNPTKTEEKQVPVIDPHPIDNPISVTDYPPPAFHRLDQHSEGVYVENFKPPKPQPPPQLKRTDEETSKPLISEPPHQLTGPNGGTNLITPKLTQPPRLLKRTNEEARKPFIPEPSHQLLTESNLITRKLTQPQTESLPRMSCVSAVGNGPNGKTVTGFLYRYTKTEVSIICVCHGISFSPAEFVKHAGRTDVSHPLKHIVVVP